MERVRQGPADLAINRLAQPLPRGTSSRPVEAVDVVRVIDIRQSPRDPRGSIPFITIPLFGACPCAAICGRQRPSPEAALFDTPVCDLDISKTAVKVTRRRILALTREL